MQWYTSANRIEIEIAWGLLSSWHVRTVRVCDLKFDLWRNVHYPVSGVVVDTTNACVPFYFPFLLSNTKMAAID